MKKNVFILFVVLLTTSVFMSCSSDDDNDNGKVENTIIINGKEYLNDESASVSYSLLVLRQALVIQKVLWI